MAQPSFPLFNVPEVPYPEMVIRSRREVDTRDAVNARQFEHWQTDGKSGVNNRPDLNKQAPFHEFKPINSRFVDREYRGQLRFDEGGDRLGMNTYFDKYATNSDSRNTIRELRSAVYENKDTEGIKESNRLLTRNFEGRWMPEEASRQMMTSSYILASEELKPKMDDIRKVWRKPQGGN